MSFLGKVAFITGAARGIGKAMAEEIVSQGGKVVIADIDEDAARMVAEQLGSALAVRCDVSDQSSVEAAVGTAMNEYPAIDILINNAGLHLTSWNRPVTELSEDQWRTLLDVNVIGIVNCARACRPHMAGRAGAAILNMSSISGVLSENAYGVSKLAVRGLTTSLAVEFAKDEIRVNGLAPGAIDSENAMEELPSELLDELVFKRQLIHRQGSRKDVVNAMTFLCTESSSFITGETLIVGGGYPRRL